MIECGYVPPGTTAADFRKLTPLVLMRALEQSGTMVCEPIMRLTLEAPTWATGAVSTAAARLGAAVEAQSSHRDLATVELLLPAARLPELQRQLPALTGGEGVLDTSLASYRPVSGTPPASPWTRSTGT